MVKKLLLILLLSWSSLTYAETIKTDVLVIGGTASGVAAAVQSARSKVKTLLVMQGKTIDLGAFPDLPADILDKLPSKDNYIVISNRNLPSGIWGEFRDRVRLFYKNTPGYDTTYNATLKFEKYTGEAILKGIADTVKNLSIKTNTTFTTIKKDGTGWEVSITANGKTDLIKAKVVIDATLKNEVLAMSGATLPPRFDPFNDNTGNLYRTSIAVADIAQKPKGWDTDGYLSIPYGIPMKYAIVTNADNLLVTNSITWLDAVFYMPIQLNVGQGVGCIAAYCAFFKTTTKNLRPRLIQQELLDYKGYLLPFADVKRDDKYIRAVQQIGATGLLKGIHKGNELLFMPDAQVTTAEINPVLTEIYSRAFLWFDKEKPGEKFTVGNTLSLISEFTLTEPDNLQTTLQRDWQTKYQFSTPFNRERPITRLEFAVLVNSFLNPFARKIDMAGNMIN